MGHPIQQGFVCKGIDKKDKKKTRISLPEVKK